jgi:hypothetical protein
MKLFEIYLNLLFNYKKKEFSLQKAIYQGLVKLIQKYHLS